MAKVKASYKVVNKMDSYINREVGRRMAETSIKMTKGSIMQEIANHCGIGVEAIKLINRNVNQPSLPVAMRIASYFDTKVENIFEISE